MAWTSDSAVSLELLSQGFYFSTTPFLRLLPGSVSSTSMNTDGPLPRDNSFMYHLDGWLQPDPCFLSNYGGHEYQAHFP